ncbi:DUF1778 domain-containing protein [Mitsuaria sp. 7]|uniref:type II toxin -antitoxin system TacA 1-like antitoxin n=1 Tax=Mitsuaria sp. 7 TaxID=1658665 RepID=UPI0007DD70B7|nr:DUF1778 domain-containing protein [Mitsuaria sp. 7]ANH67518.1 hypothetical protein ABE85_07950 [Mitsuaria sp. 7]
MSALNTVAFLHLQVPEDFCNLIDRAATLTRKNRSEFVLDAVLDATEATILDAATFCMGDEPRNDGDQTAPCAPTEDVAFQRLLARA